MNSCEAIPITQLKNNKFGLYSRLPEESFKATGNHVANCKILTIYFLNFLWLPQLPNSKILHFDFISDF